MGSATLSYIGILWMIIKLLDYAVQLNQAKMTFLNPIKSFLDDNLLYEILFIVVLAILINRNRIAAQYNLSNGYGKIVFDRCSVHHSHGNRVIEMPTSFTTEMSQYDAETDGYIFLYDYYGFNRTNDLYGLIKKQLKASGFPIKRPKPHSREVRYSLGSIAIIEYHSLRYILTGSYNTVNDQRKIDVDEEKEFFANFFWNLHKLEKKAETICIPVFLTSCDEHRSAYSRIYEILQYYIVSVKGLGKICNELRICIQDDCVNDFDLLVSMCRFLDKYETSASNGSIPIGDEL